MKTKTIIAVTLTLFFLAMSVSAQSGGTFVIEKSVIAGGGQQTTGGTFSLDGTTGQSLAGEALTGGIFSLRAGFWLPAFAPSAAMVGVSGRVKNAQGYGIRNVIVTLTDMTGAFRTTLTGTFGYFRFDDVAVGGTYIFSVSAKRHEFSQPTIVRTIFEEIADLEFIATEQ